MSDTPGRAPTGESMTQTYAISEYPDVADVYRRLEALVAQPMRPVRREKMQEYLGYFDTKCARSRELTDEAKRLIPGGVQHNLAFNYPFPIAIEKADGAYLWDVDGNRYIDFLQAGGPTVLGSNYAPVRDKVIEMLQTCGPVTGLFHVYVKYRYANMTGPGYNLPNVPYVMYFYKDYGLHGTYWHNNFGHPMSHGCVNFRTEDAGWLYNWASVGTPVSVHQ